MAAEEPTVVRRRAECAACAEQARAGALGAGWSPREAEELALVVMELATEAVLGSGEGRVAVRVGPERWEVEVLEAGRPGEARPGTWPPNLRRRGLVHVSRLSTHFTLEPLPGGAGRARAVRVRPPPGDNPPS